MNRYVLVPVVLLSLAVACNERLVVTTSVALHVALEDAKFKLSLIDSVEMIIAGADPQRPFDPPAAVPTPVSYPGVDLAVETIVPDGGTRRALRLRIRGNPFSAREGTAAAFDFLFESKSAGSSPLAIDVRLFRGERMIASGTATKNLEDAPIVTIEGEK